MEHPAALREPLLSSICEGHVLTFFNQTRCKGSVRRRLKSVRKVYGVGNNLRTEVDLKLRGTLSIQPQFICDVVYFNRFSNDLMQAASNPFDPPII